MDAAEAALLKEFAQTARFHANPEKLPAKGEFRFKVNGAFHTVSIVLEAKTRMSKHTEDRIGAISITIHDSVQNILAYAVNVSPAGGLTVAPINGSSHVANDSKLDNTIKVVRKMHEALKEARQKSKQGKWGGKASSVPERGRKGFRA